MTIRKILLDCDGVLADFVGGALTHHLMKQNPYDLEENKGRYTLEEMCGVDKKTFYGSMGFEFWRDLHPTDEGQRIYDLCVRMVGKPNVCILTKPLFTPGCVEGKREWLKKHYPKVPFLIGNEKHFCAAPGHLLVDDADVNVREFRAEGGMAHLVPRAWNERHDFGGSVIDDLKRTFGL